MVTKLCVLSYLITVKNHHLDYPRGENITEIWNTEKIERKFAPLFKWRDENESNEEKQDSCDFISLQYRRICKNPEKHVRLWRQLVDEGEAGGHKDWPLGRGAPSTLPDVIKAKCEASRAFAEKQATEALEHDEDVKYQRLKRPHNSAPLLHTDETFVKSAGQTAYNATRKSFADGHLIVNDDGNAQYMVLDHVGQNDDSTEEE